MRSNVSFTGPMFNGRAEKAVWDGLVAARRAVAKQGAELARNYISYAVSSNDPAHDEHGRAERAVTVIGNSVVMITGKYTMPVAVEDSATDQVVTTSLASYGPWLEGSGSRNETSRFKGYHSFRMAAQMLEHLAGGTADHAMQPYFDRMN